MPALLNYLVRTIVKLNANGHFGCPFGKLWAAEQARKTAQFCISAVTGDKRRLHWRFRVTAEFFVTDDCREIARPEGFLRHGGSPAKSHLDRLIRAAGKGVLSLGQQACVVG